MLGQFLCAGGLAQDPRAVLYAGGHAQDPRAVFHDKVILAQDPEAVYDVLPRTLS